MSPKEYDAWKTYMKAARGRWRIDPIHDGSRQDMLCHLNDLKDETKGVFVQVIGGTVSAGRFTDAVPHIGDAAFEVLWKHDFGNYNAATKAVMERLGVAFLLNAVCGADVVYA